MDAVKQRIREGTDPATAIRAALLGKGLTIKAFAAKHRLPRPSTTEALRGTRRPTTAQVKALIKELGGTAEEWQEVLWQAAKPEHIAKAS